MAGLRLTAVASAVFLSPATPPQPPPVSAAVQQPTADGLDVHRGWYLSVTSCGVADAVGIESGPQDRRRCTPHSGGLLWHLWNAR
ncbi:hypothetical protein [Streptomyces sp. NPDC047000]|uniref:hypothetical protein n=1 Tax=Streptomyces sp. NPDC047000 TaxID=3155474 RepID=UPI0033F7BE3C